MLIIIRQHNAEYCSNKTKKIFDENQSDVGMAVANKVHIQGWDWYRVAIPPFQPDKSVVHEQLLLVTAGK